MNTISVAIAILILSALTWIVFRLKNGMDVLIFLLGFWSAVYCIAYAVDRILF